MTFRITVAKYCGVINALCLFLKGPRTWLKIRIIFACILILYRAAVIYISPAPALMTLAISKQSFTIHPHKETGCVCFLMTMVLFTSTFQERGTAKVLHFSPLLSSFCSKTEHTPGQTRHQVILSLEIRQEIWVFYNVIHSVMNTITQCSL